MVLAQNWIEFPLTCSVEVLYTNLTGSEDSEPGLGLNCGGLLHWSVWTKQNWNQHFYSKACGPDPQCVTSNRHDGLLSWCDNSTGIGEAEWSASAWLSWALIMHAEAWIHLIQICRGTVTSHCTALWSVCVMKTDHNVPLKMPSMNFPSFIHSLLLDKCQWESWG